ncbi:hypothetical protein [Methylobacterium sp. 1030]|uniref:hypothetical protein n=1 Tax=Methylobacterium sp. 1030 TaxID=3156404 RepID=UPI00339B1364
MTKEQILKEMDQAIQDVANLPALKSVGSANTVRMIEKLFNIVDRFAPSSSSFRVKADRLRDQDTKMFVGAVIQPLTGLVKSLRDAIAADQLTRIESLIRADTFTDFLSMSEHLLNEGYKDAAAVIAGTVVEQHLRALCNLRSIPTKQPDGVKWKKAELLNQDLAKDGAITSVEQKQITHWLGLRNAAAHGEYEKYAAPQVQLMIESITFFMAQHPA